jgi:hypothetical protein
MVERGIKWERYPPGAPHMGGVHEALIRSAKRALNAVIDNAPDQPRHRLLTETQLNGLFSEVSGFLNKRPLTQASSDPRDLKVLTPYDLINVRALPLRNPPGVIDYEPRLVRTDYELIQTLANEAWTRFTREYLPTLQTREKWRQDERNTRIGDLVMLMLPNAPRGIWPTGKVVQVFPDQHGYVRSVTVRLPQGDYRRPVTRCCLLEAAQENEVQEVPEVQLAPDDEE